MTVGELADANFRASGTMGADDALLTSSTTRDRSRSLSGPPSLQARSLYLSFMASYLIGVALLASLVLAAGFWELIADTRTLALLISAGLIPLGEDDAGFGGGVPDLSLWIRSQEAVTWLLVALAAGLFSAVSLLKGLQFHQIAIHQGISGTFGQHMRAFLFGHGLGRMLPFRIGEVAWTAALDGQRSATLDRSARLAFIFKAFLIFEITIFALIGLMMSTMLAWASSLVPPFLILAVTWLLMRQTPVSAAQIAASWRKASSIYGELSRAPRVLFSIGLLSLISFSLVELASYIVPQAFATPVVLLIQDELRYVVVTPSVIVMAVVGGYIARLVPVTPGGIGQFEWGFALVLTVNGLPLPEAIALALLISAVRYFTGALLFSVTMTIWGIETNMNRVLTLFSRMQPRDSEDHV